MKDINLSDGANSRAMMHMVAKLHYQQDMAQVDIARKLGVSTATISRLLNKARAAGIVRIEVVELTSAEDISAELVQHLGLKEAAVVDTPAGNELGALSTPLAAVLSRAGLTRHAVIGIGWGRAVREVTLSGLPACPGVQVVAMNGGMQQAAAHFQINEFVRVAAEQMQGNPHFLHAPYLSSAELRDAFLCDPGVQAITSLWDQLDVAIVGVGLTHAPQPGEGSTATPDEQALNQAAGDVLRHYVTESGEILHWAGEERMIAATAAQLRKTRLSIGVAATPDKAPAIIGAARSGMINTLVTDVKTAQAILDRLLAG